MWLGSPAASARQPARRPANSLSVCWQKNVHEPTACVADALTIAPPPWNGPLPTTLTATVLTVVPSQVRNGAPLNGDAGPPSTEPEAATDGLAVGLLHLHGDAVDGGVAGEGVAHHLDGNADHQLVGDLDRRADVTVTLPVAPAVGRCTGDEAEADDDGAAERSEDPTLHDVPPCGRLLGLPSASMPMRPVRRNVLEEGSTFPAAHSSQRNQWAAASGARTVSRAADDGRPAAVDVRQSSRAARQHSGILRRSGPGLCRNRRRGVDLKRQRSYRAAKFMPRPAEAFGIVVMTALCTAGLMASVPTGAGAATVCPGMALTLSGGTSPSATIPVDDDLEVQRNGTPVFVDNDEFAQNLAPISFTAAFGDDLRVIASNSTSFGFGPEQRIGLDLEHIADRRGAAGRWWASPGTGRPARCSTTTPS